jgi:hypothetical protein
MKMVERYVGFYWTLPVYAAGFTPALSDVNEIAERSKTVTYQRKLCHNYVHERQGEMVAEVAFVEHRSDHGTDAIGVRFNEALDVCRSNRAILLVVDFHNAEGIGQWRYHHHLQRCLECLDTIHDDRGEEIAYPPSPIDRVKSVRLEAGEDIVINGELFNPAQHFGRWRDEYYPRLKENLTVQAVQGLVAAVHEVPAGYGRNAKIAWQLNRWGIRSFRGKEWTADNVRKALRDLEILQQ